MRAGGRTLGGNLGNAAAFGTNEFYHIRCCLLFGQIVCHGFWLMLLLTTWGNGGRKPRVWEAGELPSQPISAARNENALFLFFFLFLCLITKYRAVYANQAALRSNSC